MVSKYKIFNSIGLMSGTSLDGIDATIVKTDGVSFLEYGPAITLEYNEKFRNSLQSIMGFNSKESKKVLEIERELTNLHIEAVEMLLRCNRRKIEQIDIIGFHGQTINHKPNEKFTLQIGDANLLANSLKIDVVSDMRIDDLNAGGQGAPLVPVYHHACFKNYPYPIAILNIGGVSNVTWIGLDKIIAFDTGPGNSIIDDWLQYKNGIKFDEGGKIANRGKSYLPIVKKSLTDNFFKIFPPKSLDRNDFNYHLIPEGLSIEDGAATAVDIIVNSIKLSKLYFPKPPLMWVVSGGGRKNNAILSGLKELLDSEVKVIDDLGFRGDYLEAEAFAYLAVRKLNNLPTTFPSTTGCKYPICGGKITKFK